MNNELRGKPYIAYARCAAAEGSAEKLREQIQQICQFADQMAMKRVDEIQLAGVSGWTPGLRPDLRALLRRKRKNNDFEVLMVTDHARLSRAVLEEIAEIENSFLEAGVRVVFFSEMLDLARETIANGSHDHQGSDEHCG